MSKRKIALLLAAILTIGSAYPAAAEEMAADHAEETILDSEENSDIADNRGEGIFLEKSVSEERPSEENASEEMISEESASKEPDSKEGASEDSTSEKSIPEDSNSEENTAEYSVAEKKEMTAFAELSEEEKRIYLIDETVPAKEEIIKAMPKTLSVRLNGSEEEETISVSWDCEDAEYADEQKTTVVFHPVIDEKAYFVSDSLEWPEITVQIRVREAAYAEMMNTSEAEEDTLLGVEGKTAASVTGTANETTIYNFLRNKKGLSCAGTAALMGNLFVECSFDPQAYNARENAWGICQWRFERLENLQKRYPKNWKTLEAQLNFLFDEFEGRGDYMGPSTYEKLKAAEDTEAGVKDAAVYFARWFERCSSATYEMRQNRGVEFHRAYHVEPVRIVTPAEPELQLENRSTGVYITWEKVKDASGYRLFRRKASESSWTTLTANTTANAFLDTTAEPGVCYVYTIRAYSGKYADADAGGYGSGYWSGQKDNTWKNAYIASPEITLSGQADRSISLSWKPVSGAEGYQVQVKQNGDWVKLAETSKEEIELNKLTNGEIYTLRVLAYTAAAGGSRSYSAASNEKTAAAGEVEYKNMYRLYNPNSGEHFYTADASERDYLSSVGWKYEGVAWKAPSAGVPVYRLYNPNAGDHHYTTNAGERDSLKKAGWNYEGICWYSGGNTSLYRLYNPNAVTGTHHYTINENERKHLMTVGWSYEGVSWYGK
ncbi:MAG: phage tail tip lysozyme [Eubacteriales bacterium]|nr:phage tail tip lysozyme [Eubacteriales bacterium]